jgi:hypothetical protein
VDTFNLLDAPWIPVIYADGSCTRVGIKRALEDAGRIRQIAAANPMDRLAILRLLVAIIYWWKGSPAGPQPDSQIAADGGFPASLFGKLDGGRDCFNLLGDGKRFFQDSAVRREDGEKSVNYLIQEVPSGTNRWHFRHALDGVDGLCEACCALGLVRLPVFATSAGKGFSPGINAKPPVYAIPIGESLLATLMLSTLLLSWGQPGVPLGDPAWVNPSVDLSASQVPPLTGLTWLARRIWLGDPSPPHRPCILCGRCGLLIRHCVFKGRGGQKGKGYHWRDPHVLYDSRNAPLPTGNALEAVDASSGRWAAEAICALRTPGPAAGRAISIIAFCTADNDKYLEATEYTIAGIPGRAEAPCMLKPWSSATDRLARCLAPDGRAGSAKVARSAAATVRPEIEAGARRIIGRLAAGEQQAWDDAGAAYAPMMIATAGALAPGFTTRALERRSQVAGVSPGPRPQAAKRPPKQKAKPRSGRNDPH